MEKWAVTLTAIAVVTTGCASADLDGEPLTADRGTRPSCPAGELLTCELKSPNRVSDGRYGFKRGRSKRCTCQPERDVVDLRNTTLPIDQR